MADLSQDTYQSKFQSLIQLEEKEHADLLSDQWANNFMLTSQLFYNIIFYYKSYYT